jgi:hypothetical protein
VVPITPERNSGLVGTPAASLFDKAWIETYVYVGSELRFVHRALSEGNSETGHATIVETLGRLG